MKLAKSLLLGSASAFVAVVGANAADLPSKKAAPATYVKICDAYGAGFYTIPGTETCIKIGGRVRADFGFSGRQDVYASNVFANTSGTNVVGGLVYNQALTKSATSADTYIGSTSSPYDTTVAGWAFQASAASFAAISVSGGATSAVPAVASYYAVPAAGTLGTATLGQTISTTKSSIPYGYVVANGISGKSSNMYGWESRARVEIDARTPTAYGTVQAVGALRLARTTGTLDQAGPAQSSSGAGATLEAAYIRFAGFTFGAARDNFAFMPSTFYGSGHWASFANGAKQIAYTAVLGGGFSATLAVQDATDTTLGGVNAIGGFAATAYGASPYVLQSSVFNDTAGSVANANGSTLSVANGVPAYSYNTIPQINARLDFDQAWGTVSAMGVVGRAVADNTSGASVQGKATYAVGAGVKLNVPQLAAGDALWLNGGFADGMTEYTTNWTSFKSSDTKRNVGGYVVNHPSWIVTSGGIETLKSWNLAGQFTHFWSPMVRHSVMATYGSVSGTTTSKQLAWGQTGAYGDAKVWNVGTQVAFVPTKDFEIGLDLIYSRVAQDIRRLSGSNTQSYVAGTSSAAGYFKNLDGSSYSSNVTRESIGNFTSRLRVERTF